MKIYSRYFLYFPNFSGAVRWLLFRWILIVVSCSSRRRIAIFFECDAIIYFITRNWGISILSQRERWTDDSAEVIDNNLPFFLLFFWFEGVISNPLIDEANKSVDTSQTDGAFRWRAVLQPWCMTRRSAWTWRLWSFLFFWMSSSALRWSIWFLPSGLQKSQDGDNTASYVENVDEGRRLLWLQ